MENYTKLVTDFFVYDKIERSEKYSDMEVYPGEDLDNYIFYDTQRIKIDKQSRKYMVIHETPEGTEEELLLVMTDDRELVKEWARKLYI